MHIAAVFTVASKWNQLQYSSADEWVKKMWCIYTMGFFSAVKTDSIFPGKWVKLEIIVLSKISYTQTNAVFSSYVEHKVEKHT